MSKDIHKGERIAKKIARAGLCSRRDAERWIEAGRSGNVLSIVTTYAWTGSAYVLPSAMGKAGALAMTQSLAVEWGPKGIRLNAIAPGPFPTEGAWSRLVPNQALAEEFETRPPLGRPGRHDELTGLAVFLVAENLNDLHPLLAGNSRAAQVEIEMPSAGELAEAFVFFAQEFPRALSKFTKNLHAPAERLAGATLGSIESLLKTREYADEPLVESDLADLKKQLVEKDSQGLIEFLEPTRTLDDVYGHEGVKTWVRQDIELWRQNDLGAMPMGYLLCGPVGTGKTYLVECLAGEAGVPVVKMKNFRDRWVGSTEGNLEKIFNLLHALGRCIVFIDEADQALGSRDSGSGDSGVSGRVYSMMAKEMSDGRNRGRILWILASSRPDLIEIDLKRPGRVDVKIPLFPSHEPEGAYLLIRALCKKHALDLPKEIPESLTGMIPELVTPGAAESIAIKVYRQVKTKGLNAVDALRDCLDEYQNPIPPDVMAFQIDLAVREASDLDFVPESFRNSGA